MDEVSSAVNPVVVDVIRRGKVESCHRGSAVVVDRHGQTVFAIGEPERMIYPRSSLKFFQAIPLVESGAADHFGLRSKEIALACASHNAESIHTETVIGWLKRLDLGPDALECGPTLP
ncbi:MAG: asparaginase, partial [bacterium]